jgi:drug/metabolite transporter (DMT)-like permease
MSGPMGGPMGRPAARLLGRWQRLPANARGALWVTAGTLVFALNDVVVKTIGTAIHPVELAFFRYLTGFVVLFPMFLRLGRAGLRTRRPVLHGLRTLAAVAGQAAAFFAVVNMLLADVTAIFFSRALFMTVLAVLVLGEAVGRRRWGATLVGFAGVLIMVRPGSSAFEPAALVALAAALLFAIALVQVRLLARTEPQMRILFYYHVGGLALLAGPTAMLWTTPVGSEWVLVLGIGLLTTTAMFCFVSGFSIGEASVLGPMEYMRLIYATFLGLVFFGELPGLATLAGAVLIIGATLYIARRETAGRGPPGRTS